jgi:hypothetical protein
MRWVDMLIQPVDSSKCWRECFDSAHSSYEWVGRALYAVRAGPRHVIPPCRLA